MSERRLKLSIIGPLPPVPTGPADFVGNLAPYLAAHADVTLLTDQPESASPALRDVAEVRRLTRESLEIGDLNVYHIANNHHQAFAVDAALSGPAGLLTLHDVSQHHLVEYRFLGHGRPDAYQRVLEAAHGEAGRTLMRLRARVPPLPSEPFLFDCMGPLLGRHRGAIVHNMFARDVVATREAAIRAYVIPHFALPDDRTVARREELGLDPSELVIAHFGYVTIPKRPVVLLEAFARLLVDGVPARLVFGGAAEPHTRAVVLGAIHRLGIADRVQITGYLSAERMHKLVGAADIVVSLRWPHVGESSGSVVQALAAGRPLVTQRIGSWAELPADVITEIPVAAHDVEVAAMHRAFRLLLDPERRRRLGAAGRDFVRRNLDPDLYARRVVDAARDVLLSQHVSPRTQRLEACARVRQSSARIAGAYAPLLDAIRPALGRERLVAVHVPADVVDPLTRDWGYDVAVVDDVAAIGSFSAGEFSVAVCCDTVLGPAWLAGLNRVLSGAGVLIVHGGATASTAVDLTQLEDNGFAAQRTAAVCVARKAHLPRVAASFSGVRGAGDAPATQAAPR